MTHSAKFWNLLDERRTTAKENTICQISCLVNIVQGGGGDVLPRSGILENSPKTVKCVINFATDCRSKFALQTTWLASSIFGERDITLDKNRDGTDCLRCPSETFVVHELVAI